MDYIEVECTFSPFSEITSEICVAKLGLAGYESFTETRQGIKAYIPKSEFDESILQSTLKEMIQFDVNSRYKLHEIPGQNWNKKWEADFNPVIIGNKCIIKAPFHSIDKKFKYEIIIEPKMSFGTGHHETTSLMVEQLLDIDLSGKQVLDMGCGTAVLAILASMCGARKVTAIDNDDWAFRNSLENVERNNCQNINVLLGDSKLIEGEKYDIIMANINRNVLMSDIANYAQCLQDKGTLIMSGFYSEDSRIILDKCREYNLIIELKKQKNNWVAVRLSKTT